MTPVLRVCDAWHLFDDCQVLTFSEPKFDNDW